MTSNQDVLKAMKSLQDDLIRLFLDGSITKEAFDRAMNNVNQAIGEVKSQ